jgi:hypothetical protein
VPESRWRKLETTISVVRVSTRAPCCCQATVAGAFPTVNDALAVDADLPACIEIPRLPISTGIRRGLEGLKLEMRL